MIALKRKWTNKPSGFIGVERTNPLSRGVVGCWVLNDRNSSKVNDSAGKHGGAFVGSPADPFTVVNGELCVSLNGSSEYISIPSSQDFNFGTGEFTLLMRVRTAITGATDVFLSGYAASGWWFGKEPGNKAKLSFAGSSFLSTTDIADGNFHTIIATRLNGVISIAVDGVVESSTANTGSNDPDGDMAIGAFGSISGFEWPGEIAHTAIFKRGMNASEIRLLSDNFYQLLQPRIQYIDTTIAAVGDTIINATTDILISTEYTAAINAENNVNATLDALSITEYAASISLDINVQATGDTLNITENAANVNASKTILATSDSLAITEYPASFTVDTNVSATSDAITLTEYAASINAAVDIQTNTDALIVTDYSAGISLGVNINASTDALLVTEYNQSVNAENNILAGFDPLLLAEYAASIVGGVTSPTPNIRISAVDYDNRINAIQSENRINLIASENRTNIIAGD